MRAVLLRCPYCMGGFDSKNEFTRCSNCSAVHHQSCWNENHHCSVFACKGLPYRSHNTVKFGIEYLPAILLVLLSFFPALMIPFGFLWFPASICAISSTVRLVHKTLHSNQETILLLSSGVALNVAGIVAIMLRLLAL